MIFKEVIQQLLARFDQVKGLENPHFSIVFGNEKVNQTLEVTVNFDNVTVEASTPLSFEPWRPAESAATFVMPRWKVTDTFEVDIDEALQIDEAIQCWADELVADGWLESAFVIRVDDPDWSCELENAGDDLQARLVSAAPEMLSILMRLSKLWVFDYLSGSGDEDGVNAWLDAQRVVASVVCGGGQS